jgi:hypothetical protein
MDYRDYEGRVWTTTGNLRDEAEDSERDYNPG